MDEISSQKERNSPVIEIIEVIEEVQEQCAIKVESQVSNEAQTSITIQHDSEKISKEDFENLQAENNKLKKENEDLRRKVEALKVKNSEAAEEMISLSQLSAEKFKNMENPNDQMIAVVEQNKYV